MDEKYREVTCDHGDFFVIYYKGDGDMCQDRCPVCEMLKDLQDIDKITETSRHILTLLQYKLEAEGEQ